jgi:hypothetical protein
VFLYVNRSPLHNDLQTADSKSSQAVKSAEDRAVNISRSQSPNIFNDLASEDNDENFAPVPQVKVGPDGKIILNVDRYSDM